MKQTLSATDCSSETEFIAMSSISEVESPKVQQATVVVMGVGRGAVLPGRRRSRLAATFPGAEKVE